jgi:RalA-binding protein 1
MALNTAISARGNAPSVQVSVKGSPARDRNRHPFSPSSLRQTSSPPAWAPFAILPSIASPSTSTGATPQSTTAEALLKQHASSPDPKAAALEEAVANRNALFSQNTQLWILIEKQRAVHNQMLKELERIRDERDFYKGKLVTLDALPNDSSDNQLRPTSERGSNPNFLKTPCHSQTQKNSDITANQPNHRRPLKGPLHGSLKPLCRARFDRWAPNLPIFEETD